MQLTKYTDLSLRVLMHLALEPDELATTKDIAERYNVSSNHLVKVVHRLVTLGYVLSIQGRSGGICLAMPANEINVGEVVRQMENKLDVMDCVGAECPLQPACHLKTVLNAATTAFITTLDGYTVADLIPNRRQLLRLIG